MLIKIFFFFFLFFYGFYVFFFRKNNLLRAAFYRILIIFLGDDVYEKGKHFACRGKLDFVLILRFQMRCVFCVVGIKNCFFFI